MELAGTVAVVGGGAAGMGAAYALIKAGLPVTLFEAEPKLGGHCFGVSMPLPDGKSARVDAGVSDFNRATFTTVGNLLTELGVDYYPVCQDASFMTPDGAPVWFSRAGTLHFLRPPESPEQFKTEITRFNTTCIEVLSDGTFAEWTTQKYLDARGYSEDFRRLYFNPRAQGCFPMPDKPPAAYMIRSLVAFWRMHGIVGPGRPDRMIVRGGMHAYCAAFEDWVRQREGVLQLGTRVVGISRRKNRIRIRALSPVRENLTFEFEHVVIASNANQVIPLLEDATQEERRIYAGFGWQRSRLVVHRDNRLMPHDRATWGAYNYLVSDGTAPEIRPTITFYPNRLASLDADVPDVFVTMNPFREPDPGHIITNQFFVHPSVGGITDMACERLDAIQGRRGTWFCGSYVREPFVHEQAMSCGFDIGQRLVAALSDEQDPAASSMTGASFDDFLRENALFAGLDSMALAEVQLAARPVRLRAGDTLFKQGDESDGTYLLKEGTISIVRRSVGGATRELVRLTRGALIGEMGLLDRGRRSASAVAVEPSSGYFVSRARFDLLRANCDRAAFAVVNRFVGEVGRRTRIALGEIIPLYVADANRAAPAHATTAEPNVETLVAPVWSEAFSRIPFFGEIGAEGFSQLMTVVQVQGRHRGGLVFRQGEAVTDFFIVLRGALTYDFESEGRSTPLVVLGPGRVAGELAVLDGRAQALTCRVREDATVLKMSWARFEELRQGGSALAFRVLEAIANSLVLLLRKANGHLSRSRNNTAPIEAMLMNLSERR